MSGLSGGMRPTECHFCLRDECVDENCHSHSAAAAAAGREGRGGAAQNNRCGEMRDVQRRTRHGTGACPLNHSTSITTIDWWINMTEVGQLAALIIGRHSFIHSFTHQTRLSHTHTHTHTDRQLVVVKDTLHSRNSAAIHSLDQCPTIIRPIIYRQVGAGKFCELQPKPPLISSRKRYETNPSLPWIINRKS